jgi:hypothetical protein
MVAIILVSAVCALIVWGLTSFSIIEVDTENAWIGFWGSAFGAIASTLMAERSYKQNNELHEKKRKDDIRPEVYFKKESDSKTIDDRNLAIWLVNAIKDDNRPHSYGPICLSIKNVGKSTAKNLRFESTEIKIESSPDNTVLEANSTAYLTVYKRILNQTPKRDVKVSVNFEDIDSNLYSTAIIFTVEHGRLVFKKQVL